MTHFSRRHALLISCALIALTGAGCLSAEPAQPSQPQEPVQPPAQLTPPAQTTSTAPTAPTSTSVLPPIDATWKTYVNATLGISFKYPTKGVYVPTWGVTVLKPTDARVQGGCYVGDAAPRQNKGQLQVGDTSFCVTRYEDAGAGQRYETDYYVATLDGHLVLITFSKHLSLGDNFDDPACHGSLVVTIGTTCKPVDIGIYNAVLDEIIGTYTHK
jgi:hypothetical protein